MVFLLHFTTPKFEILETSMFLGQLFQVDLLKCENIYSDLN